MTVTMVRRMEFGDSKCIYMYNVFFRKIFYALKMCQINRNFYLPNGPKLPQLK